MKRTDQQRNAIEVYCHEMAEGLNDTDLSVQTVCTLPISWTQQNFKDYIWKKVQAAMYPDTVNEQGKVSTTQLSTGQVSEVYEEVNRLMAGWGVSRDFPSEDRQTRGVIRNGNFDSKNRQRGYVGRKRNW